MRDDVPQPHSRKSLAPKKLEAIRPVDAALRSALLKNARSLLFLLCFPCDAHLESWSPRACSFVQASIAQAAHIASLEKTVAALKEDLQTAREQLEVQVLIGESRARQLDEQRTAADLTETRLMKMRSAVRLLWGLLQEWQMRTREQEDSVRAGSELLESLEGLLSEPEQAGHADTPSKSAAEAADSATVDDDV